MVVTSCSQRSFFGKEDVLLVEDTKAEVNYSMLGRNPYADVMVFNKRVPNLNSLLVCRDKQCAPAELSMSKQYIFNALAQLVDNNADSTALICEANPQAHVCVNPYLTVPAKIGVTPSYVYFDSVKLIDAAQVKGKQALDLVLGYNLSYNGQTPYVCKPDKAMLYVKDNDNVVLNGNGFDCDMTSQGVTSIRVMFDIDYIDLDYGYIGGYYSIGLNGPAYGGGSGYGMIRLIKDAHPLNPSLMSPKIEPKVETPVVKQEVKAEEVAKIETKVENESTTAKAKPKEEKVDEKDVVVVRDDTSKKLEKAETKSNVEPLKMIENDTVKNIEIRDDVEDIRPSIDTIDDEDYGPEFEEIEIEDLDEYIK